MSKINPKTNDLGKVEASSDDESNPYEVLDSKIKSIEEEVSVLLAKKHVLKTEKDRLKEIDRLVAKKREAKECQHGELEDQTTKKLHLSQKEKKLLKCSELRGSSYLGNAVSLLLCATIALIISPLIGMAFTDPNSSIIIERVILIEAIVGLLIGFIVRNLLRLKKVENILKEQASHREIQRDIKKTIVSNLLKSKSPVKVQ